MHRMTHAALVAALMTATWLAGGPALAGSSDTSPRTVINRKTYIWLFPRFWMAGEKSYAIIQIENTFDHPISFYLHCQGPEGSIAGMTGRYSLRPGQIKTVDSRRHQAEVGSGREVLVHCSMKSHSRATVRRMIRDGRSRHFGDESIVVHPQVS